MMNSEQLTTLLAQLATHRPVFHSEADFQHELALRLSYAGYRVRLEVPLTIQINGSDIEAQLDLLVIDPDQQRTAIELKYVTEQKLINRDGEIFNLKGNWGTNLSRFDGWADFRRVGAFVAAGHVDKGLTVFLTNKEDAWNVDASQTDNLGQQFSMHEGRDVGANSMLDWVGNVGVNNVGTKRLPPYSPIHATHGSVCSWKDYSDFEGRNGRFRYLLHEV